MQPPFYSPPYDSPIENDFAYHLVKYLNEIVDLATQHRVDTLCGVFIIDFLLALPSGRKIGIECDGREFHNEARDEWRDAMILGSTDIEAIYRIRGQDIYWNIDNVLYVLSRVDPQFFSLRGLANLENLAGDDFKRGEFSEVDSELILLYKNDGVREVQCFSLTKLHKNIPAGRRQFWQALYRYATEVGGGNLDEIIAKYRTSRFNI